MAGANEGTFRPHIDAPELPPGTVIVQQQQTQGAPVDPWPFLIGLLGPLLPFLLFVAGYSLMDRPEPDTAAAGALYSATVLAAAAPVVLVAWRRLHLWSLIPAAAGGIPMGMLVAYLGQTGYGLDGAGLMLGLAVHLAVPLFVAYLVLVITLAATRGAPGAGMGLQCLGLIQAVGYATAAIYHLSSLQHQATLARDSYNSPGLEVVVLVAALLGLGAWCKMRA